MLLYARATRPGGAAQVVPGDAELAHQLAQQGERDADDVARVALDARDVRPAQAVEGEGPGHPQRLAGGDVGVDLGVVEVGEVHRRGCRAAHHAAGAAGVGVAQVDQPVAGVQHAGAAPHPSPARRPPRRRRPACRAPRRRARAPSRTRARGCRRHVGVHVTVGVVDLERGDDVLGLGPGEQQGDVGRLERLPATVLRPPRRRRPRRPTTPARAGRPRPPAGSLRRAGEAEARSSAGWADGIRHNLVRVAAIGGSRRRHARLSRAPRRRSTSARPRRARCCA